MTPATRRVLLPAAFLVLAAILLTGCWDRTEVDALALVVGFGIDRVPGDNPILVTAQIINPSAMKTGRSGGGSEPPFIVKTSQGQSMFDAVRNMSRELSRVLFFEEVEAVVFGRDFARSGVAEALDYMVRDRQFHANNLVLVAENTAQEVLSARMALEKVPARGLKNLLTDSPFVAPVTRNDLLMATRARGAGYLPLIKVVTHPEEASQGTPSGQGMPGGGGGGSGAASSKEILVENMAVLRNYRWAGSLTREESAGLLWLRGRSKADTVVIKSTSGGREAVATIDILNGRTRMTPRFTRQGIVMDILCRGKATLREAGNTGMDIAERESFQRIERAAERVLVKRVESTIDRAQHDLNTDILGFSTTIQNYSPALWRTLRTRWTQVLPEVESRVRYQIEIISPGALHGSVNQIR